MSLEFLKLKKFTVLKKDWILSSFYKNKIFVKKVISKSLVNMQEFLNSIKDRLEFLYEIEFSMIKGIG